MALPTTPFVAAKSIFAGLSAIKLQLDASITGVTAATTVVTKATHGLVIGDVIEYVSGTGFTGLVAGSTYFVTTTPDADTFTLSVTLTGSPISVGTSSAGVIQPVVVFEVDDIDDEPTQEEKALERPDSTGTLRPVRKIRTKEAEMYKFALAEPKRMLEIFSNAMSGRRTGYCTIYIPDPDDASGFVSLKSEKFACTVTRDGSMKFGGADFTKASIKVDSNKSGSITWTSDGAVPA